MFNTSNKRQIRPTREKKILLQVSRLLPSGHDNKLRNYLILFNLINLINLHQICGPNLLTPT